MIRAPFQLHTPQSVDEAVQLLAQCDQNGEDAKLLAGGQSFIPTMNLGLSTPAHVISLNHVAGLSSIRQDNDTIAIGARTTHRDLSESELLQTHCPILSEAAASIGDVQVRNRGTLGGSIGHFDPAADYPPVLVLLDATFRLVGPNGERTVTAQDFFVDYMTTSLSPDEVVTEVRVPVLPSGTGSAYTKFTRVEGGFAIVGVGACLALNSDGACQSVRVGICGAAPVPVRLTSIETAMVGQAVDETFIENVAQAAYASAQDPVAELHADAEYKKAMVRVFTRRAVKTALERTR